MMASDWAMRPVPMMASPLIFERPVPMIASPSSAKRPVPMMASAWAVRPVPMMASGLMVRPVPMMASLLTFERPVPMIASPPSAERPVPMMASAWAVRPVPMMASGLMVRPVPMMASRSIDFDNAIGAARPALSASAVITATDNTVRPLVVPFMTFPILFFSFLQARLQRHLQGEQTCTSRRPTSLFQLDRHFVPSTRGPLASRQAIPRIAAPGPLRTHQIRSHRIASRRLAPKHDVRRACGLRLAEGSGLVFWRDR